MKKQSLKDFDPDIIAELDLKMWRAYYERKFLKLFILLFRLNQQFFRFNYLSTLKATYYSASATIDFRLNRGKENHKRITRKLTRFFKIISDNSIEEFDYKKAAELELNWWLVDRYPDRYTTSREGALAMAMANLFGVEPSKLSEFGNYGAQAMVLRDEARSEGKEFDWNAMGSLLNKSFNSLHKNIR